MTGGGHRTRSGDRHRLDQRGELARALPAHGPRQRRRRLARRRRRRQRIHRRHARAGRIQVPLGARRRFARTTASRMPTTAAPPPATPATSSSSIPTPKSSPATSASSSRRWTRRPEVGLVGVRQLTGDGILWPTIRYFPSFGRAIGEALASERWPARPRWAGERELDLDLYEREHPCDWTSGSFMLARREALMSSGSARRALLHLLRGDRPLPADQAGGLGDPPPAGDDDRPPRRQGRRAAENGGTGCLRASPVRGQAFRAAAPRRLPGRDPDRTRYAGAGPRA